MMKKLFATSVLSFLIWGCTPKGDNAHALDSSSDIRYAAGFKVTAYENYKKVEVLKPYKNASSGYTYLLVQKGKPIPKGQPGEQVIMVPLSNIVCTSTTHIPLLDYLGETSKLIGFPTNDYISSSRMRQRIDSGNVVDLGIDKGMNIELLMTLKPSMVMGYAMGPDLGQLKKIQELGMPVVINAEYLEKHPLGRAEWIKFMGLFFNKEKQADSVFQIIEGEYLRTHDLVKDLASRPTVLSGIVYGDTWFLPGGQNYAAKLLDDAGLEYLWKNDSTTGFQELSFESVYQKAKEADLWIGVGSYSSLTEMKAAQQRYGLFKPVVNGKVYSYNFRKGAKGGSEFLELGYLRPDFILKDLVKIGHPDLLPGYELFFHSRLN